MARTGDPNSATAQFFINVNDNKFLNFRSTDVQGYGYTVFGKVVDGMDVVDKIAKAPTGGGGPFPKDVPSRRSSSRRPSSSSEIGDYDMVILHTNHGDITLELDAEKAPKTVANFLQYVDDGHYDGTIFHRVIDGFMIQGGGFDARHERRSRPSAPIENEARQRPEERARHRRDGAHVRPALARPRSSSSTSSTTASSTTARRRRQGWRLLRVRQGHRRHGRGRQDQGRRDRQRAAHQNVPKEDVVIERARKSPKDRVRLEFPRRLIRAPAGQRPSGNFCRPMPPTLFISDLHLSPSGRRWSTAFERCCAGPARGAGALRAGRPVRRWIGDDQLRDPLAARVADGAARGRRRRRPGVGRARQSRLPAGRAFRPGRRRHVAARAGRRRPARHAYAADARRRAVHRRPRVPASALASDPRAAAAVSGAALLRAPRDRRAGGCAARDDERRKAETIMDVNAGAVARRCARTASRG